METVKKTVKRNEKMQLNCSLKDYVRCTDCDKVCKVGDLVAVNGHTIPKHDGAGGNWQQIFYYCSCDQEHPKVYDPGDGKLVVVYLGHCELILKG